MKRFSVLTAFLLAALGIGYSQIEGNPQTKCLSNAKQIAIACLMYTADYDDVLPYVKDTETLAVITMPYMKNNSLWKTGNPAGSTFEFNLALGGVSTNSIPQPATTVLIYESKPWADGRRIVTYTDGHAKIISPDVWTKDQLTLKLKLKKVAKKPLPKQKLSK